MRYVVAYDIEPDPVRNRIASVCEAFGVRVQKSVFEAELDDTGLEEVVHRLEAALSSADVGSIRIYKVCAGCLESSLVIGRVADSPGSASCFVV